MLYGLSLQMPEVNSDCFPLVGVAILVGHPPSRCVAMLGVDLAEMTGANSGCLLCPVDYPCIGRCRHVWWVILADARSQQRLSSIDGCRCSRWIILAVCCALWVILASVGVAVLDGSSLLSVALYGSSLQMPEVNSDCFPLMGVAILGVILH